MITVNNVSPRYDTHIPITGTNTKTDANAITNAAGGAMGKDEFVKLLIAQMQNQDPMNPMDGKDLAAQLAQFSSVEQLMDINTKMDTLTKALKIPTSTTNPATNS